MAIPEPLKHTVGRVLGQIPSGVFIISAVHEGNGDAQLASWIQQAAFEPPCITVALGRTRSILPIIRGSGRFAISILGEADRGLMKRYARGVQAGEDPFADVRTLNSPGGIPVMAEALGYLDCSVLRCCEFGADHDLVIGQVMAGELLKEAKPFVHIRNNGFHY
ncbi:MAG: flavin reductase family protein [Bacillota bacterium]